MDDGHSRTSKAKAREIAAQLVGGEPSNRTGTKDLVKGSIVRLKMENFMIYDSCEFRPGPHLNVLIGPNGTGKSTIVCAICLGLAGKTSLLGRSKEVGEFVKYGHNHATLEVELCNPGGRNTIIRRDITRQGNTSTWCVNGNRKSLREVEETVANHSVQLSNLCQFLPQDKVVEFAKMSKQELLESTEKSVGKPELYEYHQKLKNSRNREKELISAHKGEKERLKKLQEKNARLEADVQRFEERQRHLERITILEKKRPWVEYDLCRRRYMDLKVQRDNLHKAFKEAQKQNTPLQKQLNEIHAKIKNLDAQLKEKSDEIRQLANMANKRHEGIEKLVEDALQVQEELKEKMEEDEKRKKKINDWKKQLEAWQRELHEMGEEDAVQPEVDRINKECREINNKVRRIDAEMEMISRDRSDFKTEIKRHKDMLKSMNDLKDRRLKALKQKHRDTANAVEWLRANKHMFKATIHEPMALVIDMHNRENAKFIEMHIPGNDLRAFVCEDAEDMEKFLHEMRDNQHLRINAVKSPQQNISTFQPRRPIEELRRWGFTCYLKDLFESPDAVMSYLCKFQRIHEVPLGTPYTRDNVSKVIAESGLRHFYTPEHNYVIRQSRYGNRSTSSRSTAVGDAQLLYNSIDPNDKRELEQQLQEAEKRLHQGELRYVALTKERQICAEEDNKLRERKKELQKKRDRRRAVIQNIKAKQDSISRNEAEGLNLEKEEKKAKQMVTKINEKKMKLVIDLQDVIQKCLEANKNKVKVALQQALAYSERSRFEAQIREGSQQLQNLKHDFERATELKDLTKQEGNRLINIAKQKTGTDGKDQLPTVLKEAFSQFPGTLEEIDDMIHHERARADCFFETEPSVVNEYNQRKKEIAKLSLEVDQKKHLLEQHQQEIAEIKHKWLDPLQELIAVVSDRFSHFFKYMGCAGEVDLYKGENEEDYDKYGIRIRVKFRKTENLRELTSSYQSGGERSVSTILYMMALQELNRCPFRVVDEINQGMDHNNERKVFELVVRTACRDCTSQYFLITPKLLPNLSYGPKMTVLCVYNGHWMMPHSSWDIKDFCRKRRLLDTS
ncbi:structural maintenance of chromosomes protein 5-like isoform X2 [Glandiceps talaboti]